MNFLASIFVLSSLTVQIPILLLVKAFVLTICCSISNHLNATSLSHCLCSCLIFSKCSFSSFSSCSICTFSSFLSCLICRFSSHSSCSFPSLSSFSSCSFKNSVLFISTSITIAASRTPSNSSYSLPDQFHYYHYQSLLFLLQDC